jgi:(2Fe-2S) ferredoxin
MKPVDTQGCLAHILVCKNLRDHPTMPCCARSHGEEVYDALRRWIASKSMLTRIWITPTGCLGWCHREGTTIVIYPENVWYRGVTPADLPEILARHLEPLLTR